MMDERTIERIIAGKRARLEDLSKPEIWYRYTKNMECEEFKEFKQSCADDEAIIEALEFYRRHLDFIAEAKTHQVDILQAVAHYRNGLAQGLFSDPARSHARWSAEALDCFLF